MWKNSLNKQNNRTDTTTPSMISGTPSHSSAFNGGSEEYQEEFLDDIVKKDKKTVLKCRDKEENRSREDEFRLDTSYYNETKSSIEIAGEDLNKRNNCLFKQMTHFFADRKFITIAFVHLAITLVIFSE